MTIKLTLKDLNEMEIEQLKDERKIVIKVSNEKYQVDISNKASAILTITSKSLSNQVKISGTFSPVLKLISAVNKVKPKILKSIMITITGNNPIEL